MNNLRLRKKAELALICSIPVLSDAKENSRLGGLQRKLQRTILPQIHAIQDVTSSEMAAIIQKIKDWGIVANWLHSRRHISTGISFCLRMVEQSPVKHDPKITEILVALAEHLDQSKSMRMLSCKAGDIAYEKWEKMFK